MGITSGADDVAIVLVDHGSKRAEANAMLEDFADLYRFARSPSSANLSRTYLLTSTCIY